MKQWILPIGIIIGLMTVFTGNSFAGETEGSETVIKSGYISVPQCRLYYEDAGQGPCIVFLHDGMLHSEAYDPQFTAFADDYRVVRYDRRRYGRSDVPQAPYSNCADLKAVFDTLKIDSALLVGCSSGSRLAIDFTLMYPDLVTGLVLIGPVVSGMGYTSHMTTRGGHLTSEIRSDAARLRDYWIDDDPYEILNTNTKAKARARELLTAYPQNIDAGLGHFQQRPERPALQFLNEIKVPTLIIVGEGDIPDVHAHAGAIEAGISGARREIVSDAGHLTSLEKPQEVNDLIRAFLIESQFFGSLPRLGVPAAINNYRKLLAKNPETKPFEEARLNQLGYQYLQNGNISDALEFFKLAVELYPGSSNVYDSYGEALLTNGDTAQAIFNYKKSLELNTDNTNAAQVLEKLKAK